MSQKIAFLFPGQGAQSVGMCRQLYETYGIFRDTVHEIEDTIYRKLWPIIVDGPERELKKTTNCQLALFAVSLSTLRVIQFEKPHLKPDFCAGLSLGEYTALVAAGIMRLKEAAEIVEKRASLMQQACDKYPGKMTAVLGLTYEQVQAIIEQYKGEEVLAIANYNAHQQIVVAGTQAAIAWFEVSARQAGARRLIELDVAGAFHSPLMQDAADGLRPFIDTVRLDFSDIKVVSNVTGERVIYSEDFRDLLVSQITHPVLWSTSIHNLDQYGVNLYIEIGPGRVLHGLNRKIGTMSRTYSVETVEDIAALP